MSRLHTYILVQIIPFLEKVVLSAQVFDVQQLPLRLDSFSLQFLFLLLRLRRQNFELDALHKLFIVFFKQLLDYLALPLCVVIVEFDLAVFVGSFEMTSYGDRHNKASVNTFLGKYLYCAAEGNCKTLCDKKSKTDAFFVDRLILLHYFAEKFEKILDVFLTDSDSSVVNLKAYCFLYCDDIFIEFHRKARPINLEHDVSFLRELCAVPQTVNQYLLKSLKVRVHHVRHII